MSPYNAVRALPNLHHRLNEFGFRVQAEEEGSEAYYRDCGVYLRMLAKYLRAYHVVRAWDREKVAPFRKVFRPKLPKAAIAYHAKGCPEILDWLDKI